MSTSTYDQKMSIIIDHESLLQKRREKGEKKVKQYRNYSIYIFNI